MADTPHCHCLVLERPVSGQAAVAFRRSACAETFRLRARLGGRWTSPLQPSLHAAVIPAARQRLLYCCVSVTALQADCSGLTVAGQPDFVPVRRGATAPPPPRSLLHGRLGL